MVNKIIVKVFFVFVTSIMLCACVSENTNSNDGLVLDNLNTDTLMYYYIIKPDTIIIGDTAILTLTRKSIKLKNLRGVIGKYDSNFILEEGAKEYTFYGDDYSTSIFLVPDSVRTHTYRGYLEEYEIVNDSVEKYYGHKFEVKLVVKEKSSDE